MALVKSFVHRASANVRFRTEVECGWAAVDSPTGPLLHLETYGSSGREIPGKVSQSLELDEEAARQLRAILDATFPPT